MTKEQEAIKNIKICIHDYISESVDEYGYTIYKISEEEQEFFENIETLLNMLKEKDEQIAKYEKIYKEYDCYRWVKELEKKDKQIDLMAEYISKRDVEEDICMKNKTNPDWCNEDYTNCKDCIKQYFKELAERKSEK